MRSGITQITWVVYMIIKHNILEASKHDWTCEEGRYIPYFALNWS